MKAPMRRRRIMMRPRSSSVYRFFTAQLYHRIAENATESIGVREVEGKGYCTDEVQKVENRGLKIVVEDRWSKIEILLSILHLLPLPSIFHHLELISKPLLVVILNLVQNLKRCRNKVGMTGFEIASIVIL
jgi:hypothetical protein